jgi:hypothetical protein
MAESGNEATVCRGKVSVLVSAWDQSTLPHLSAALRLREVRRRALAEGRAK